MLSLHMGAGSHDVHECESTKVISRSLERARATRLRYIEGCNRLSKKYQSRYTLRLVIGCRTNISAPCSPEAIFTATGCCRTTGRSSIAISIIRVQNLPESIGRIIPCLLRYDTSEKRDEKKKKSEHARR